MTIALILGVIGAIVFVTAVWKIHPLPVLVLGGLIFGVCSGNTVLETLAMVSTGFGNTMKSIGLVILAGTLIGAFMEQRGALKVIAMRIISLVGKKHTPLGMTLIGYLVSICIFCDSAFIILIGLWKKIGLLAKLPLAVGACALSMGLFASHCFIPPTPGPLAAMSLLKADFAYVLLFGSIAAFAAASAGYIYALYAGKNELLADEEQALPENVAEIQETEDKEPVHFLLAFLPILIPLLLIGGNSLVNVFKNSLPGGVIRFMAAAGHPLTALGVGAFLAIFVIGKVRKEELTVEGVMGKAILEGGNILVITAGGGAFGEVLKHVDLSAFLPEKVSGMGPFALLIPLGMASMLKIAQGSSTLAILTGASVTLPLLETLQLTSPVMRALTCCAVCCGGMIVSHTNDSYFWVVTRFSKMSVSQGLKLQTGGTFVSGSAAAVVLLILAAVL